MWMGGCAGRLPPATSAPPPGQRRAAGNLAKQRIDTEDDVLHLKDLPDFDGRLKASEVELLLQYLPQGGATLLGTSGRTPICRHGVAISIVRIGVAVCSFHTNVLEPPPRLFTKVEPPSF